MSLGPYISKSIVFPLVYVSSSEVLTQSKCDSSPSSNTQTKYEVHHLSYPPKEYGGKKRNKSHLSGQEGRSRCQTDAQKLWRILKLWKAHGIKSTRQKKKKRLEKNRTQFWRRLLWRWTVTRNLQDGRQSEMALSCDAAHWIWSNLLMVGRILSS